ncbi:MAG: hypothetical protein M1830_001068, partial [Pleopsidium flavum]
MTKDLGRKVGASDSGETGQGKRFKQSRKLRWSVQHLSNGMRDGSISPQRPMLKIQPKALNKRSGQSPESVTLTDHPNKKLKYPDIRCYCGLTIWGPKSIEKDPLVKKAQECTIRTALTPAGEVKAQIEMDEPLILNASELFVGVQRSTYSKLTITDSYHMEIMFLPLDSREVWPAVLVKPVKGRVSPQADNVMANHVQNDQVLVAKWTKLPNCPPKGAPLSIQAFKNRKPYKANISLELDAAWCRSTTPLEHYNSQLRHSPPARLPTPISEPETLASTTIVIWTFGDMPPEDRKTLTMFGYLCPACERKDFCTYDNLHFHLLTNHDLLKFHVTREQKNEVNGLQVVVRISVAVADDYRNRAANDVKDDRVFCWERPKHPFDLQSFLAGDENWIGKSSRRPPPALHIHQLPKASRSQSWDTLNWASQRVDPSNVLDLPVMDRKKHPVPSAPAEVTFFRANSKRPLKESEAISESDDDVNEAWLKHKHGELIQDFSHVTVSEKNFMKKYDAYMLMEELSGNTHFADATVRFCRNHKEWLRRPDMYKEFLKNAASLITLGTISEPLLQGCIRIIRGLSTEDDQPPKRKRRGRRRRIISSDDDTDVDCEERDAIPKIDRADMDMRDVDETSNMDLGIESILEETRTQSRGYNRCICGEEVKDLRAAINCAHL